MKINRTILFALALLVISASLYRVWDGRPFGFAPHIAIAIFSGAIMKNKKWSFLLPLLSLFISDAFYQLLYVNGLSEIPGFYQGQISNYILFTSLTVFGFMISSFNWLRIAAASVAAPTAYFILSNFMVWIGGGGYGHPKTMSGLMATFIDGVPFYQYSLLSTLLFSGVFFGSFYFGTKTLKQPLMA